MPANKSQNSYTLHLFISGPYKLYILLHLFILFMTNDLAACFGPRPAYPNPTNMSATYVRGPSRSLLIKLASYLINKQKTLQK